MGRVVELDAKDRRILGVLQEDASLTISQLGERVGLSANPCWRRVKRLEDEGVIERRVAVVAGDKVGLPVTAFVFIRTQSHDAAWLDAFAKAINDIPEIVECHRMSGSVDYLLKLAVADIAHYDRVYKRLIDRAPNLADVTAGFSMERVKRAARAVPL